MCIKFPFPAPPSLPSPFTLGVGFVTPPIGLNPALCCKFNLPLSVPAIPIGVPLIGAVTTGITIALAAVNAYIDQLSPRCPLE